ncbi:MAG: allene oxide cyclase barrel-like domain-containing protein [Acidimicrobiia bacterium]
MRRVLIAVLSAALLGGVALTTVASAHEGGEDLHYVAKATSYEKTDLGSGGKQLVVNFDLFEHAHDGDAEAPEYSTQDHGEAAAVGHGVAICVTANPGEGILCTGNIMVDDGQISTQGIIHIPSHSAASADGDSHPVMLPITGGSGRFVGASGELEISHAKTEEPAEEPEADAPEAPEGGGDDGSAPMRAFGMAPADHPPSDGGGHGGGHALHFTFHLAD